MLRTAATNKVNLACDNTLRVRKKIEVHIIVRRHVATKQRNSLPSWRIGKNSRPDSRYNRYNQRGLTQRG
jgi:hypothetical protein